MSMTGERDYSPSAAIIPDPGRPPRCHDRHDTVSISYDRQTTVLVPRLVAEFPDRLDLHDATLVGNDTGGALVQLPACRGSCIPSSISGMIRESVAR
jgi:pimeloyl-ACP methyl ester carboxylesterase